MPGRLPAQHHPERFITVEVCREKGNGCNLESALTGPDDAGSKVGQPTAVIAALPAPLSAAASRALCAANPPSEMALNDDQLL
jgi:hypothetical protein